MGHRRVHLNSGNISFLPCFISFSIMCVLYNTLLLFLFRCVFTRLTIWCHFSMAASENIPAAELVKLFYNNHYGSATVMFAPSESFHLLTYSCRGAEVVISSAFQNTVECPYCVTVLTNAKRLILGLIWHHRVVFFTDFCHGQGWTITILNKRWNQSV